LLKGNAFVIMWHDITPEADVEYNHWHSEQHMPERLNHCGFQRSRRAVKFDGERQRYFTLYEGDELDTFLGEDYQRSLNQPTEWSSCMAPKFRNFLRSVCEVKYTSGRGVGGALRTIRGDLPARFDEQAIIAASRPLLEELNTSPLVCGVHLALARPDYSSPNTREVELRPEMDERQFQFVLVIESFNLPDLETLEPLIDEVLALLGCSDTTSQSYELALMLTKEEC